MKKPIACWAVAIISAPLVWAQLAGQSDPDRMVQGGAAPPAGWKARLDNGSTTIAGVKLTPIAAGLHFVSGPAGIYYRPEQAPSGNYEVRATFTQMEPSAHPEAYGLFIGGSNLEGANQKYTYFLIRQDGMFLVKRRAGRETPTVTNWTGHVAIRKAPSGKVTNELTTAVGKDTVRFLVNGTEASSAPRARLDTTGIAGLRINHNLNVQVANFGVRQQ